MARKKRIVNEEKIIYDIDKNKYKIIEILDKKGIPTSSIWFRDCSQVEQSIKEFEKNHPDLDINEVYFWKEKKCAYITYIGIK
jgi:hypothetical protein